MDLDTKITEVRNIGPFYQKKLKKLGIEKVKDLVFHFPRKYNDFSNIIPVAEAKIGEKSCFRGKILEIKNQRTFRKRMVLTNAIIEDESSAIKVVWFNQPYLTDTLKKGDEVCLAGKIALRKSEMYLQNPVYEKITLNVWRLNLQTLTHTGRIVPVYPETEGLSSRWLRYILRPLLTKFRNEIEDPLPEKIRENNNLLAAREAIWQAHFPDSLKLAKEAKLRFSFEELFFIELFVLRERMKIAKEKAKPVLLKADLIKKFVQGLPFELTPSQRKSAFEILKDLEKKYPMNRLLEGDVGSGKTVVAAIAALNTVKQSHQVALMAPTEVLARQHFKTLTQLLKDFELNVGLLTGKEDRLFSKKLTPSAGSGSRLSRVEALNNQFVEMSRKKLLEEVKNKKVDILVGTHALIQKEVKFQDLALVVVDEQHRFGVKQRAKLCQTKGFIPHLLSMTATPIPRTLALTVYGDLDLSLLTEMPKGRKKIITKVVSPKDRRKAYEFIKNEVKKGRQVFVICPRIEPSKNAKYEVRSRKEEEKGSLGLQTSDFRLHGWAEVKSVEEEYKKLSEKVFPNLKIGMLHGKMNISEKRKVMDDFKKKKIDILVSTSVVEVGVDIPNATVMMIEGAEMFGLAQLHQFRGRVGRSHFQSFCFLFTSSFARNTRLRLKALLNSKSGFELAEKDLKIRGPGDFFGNRQWGIPDLTMDALKNIKLVEKARQSAKEILQEDPDLKNYPLLREELSKFQERVHLE